MNNTNVDSFLRDGCGRCDKYQTPDCKVHQWTDALVALRELLRETELVEAMKWGFPTYTLNGKNVVMIAAFKGFAGLSFFKGVLLEDPGGVLEAAGPNSRIARLLKFQSNDGEAVRKSQAAAFIRQAIELERAGAKVVVEDAPEPMPFELEERLEADSMLREAFEALTPGRQRSYILHVSGAKQSTTRERRVEQCIPKILTGKGFNER